MNTIREALIFNLRLLRGSKTQAEMAEFLDVPFGTYQKIEQGNLPRPATMTQITKRLGISEISLVQLPGETAPKGPPSRASLLGSILIRLAALDEHELGSVVHALEAIEGLRSPAKALQLRKNQK